MNEIQKDEEIDKEEMHKLMITKKAMVALANIVERVNDGFVGGKINRTKAANWVLEKFNEDIDDDRIKEIRIANYDEIAVLENIFKTAKESGKVPVELKALLLKQLEINEQPKKGKKRD